MTTIGIMAGAGHMPVLGVRSAIEQGWDVFVVEIGAERNPHLAQPDTTACHIPIWQYERVVDTFVARGVEEVYVLGKLPGTLVNSPELDDAARAVLAQVTERGEHAVIGAFVADMARRGLRVRSQVELFRPYFVPIDFAAGRTPTEAEWRDIGFGYDVACALADKTDAGQTVVVKGGVVLALEAVEGTDAAIRRGGRLGGAGAVVVKAKGVRELAFELPAVGPETLSALEDVGATVLALEAERMLLLERETVIARAEAAGIALVAVKGAD